MKKKKVRVDQAKSVLPLSELKRRARDADKTRDFRKAVTRGAGPIRLIAEIKKASPSGGIMRADFDPIAIGELYERGRVDAISILTEEDFFQGHLSYLHEVKKVTSKPLLRKDFIFDEYQIYESRIYGADAILLIAMMLERNQAQEYLHIAEESGLSALFEIHNENELEKALFIGAKIIGVNNRNLITFKIDISNSLTLKQVIPEGKIVISESGIKDRSDVSRFNEAGFDAVLVGTSLMSAEDIGEKIDELTC